MPPHALSTTTQEEEEEDNDMETTPEVTRLQELHQVLKATLRSLEPFDTETANRKKQDLADEIQEVRHAITMAKPLDQRMQVFETTLENRIKAMITPRGAMVLAELEWEKAWEKTERTAEQYKAKQTSCNEIRQLLDRVREQKNRSSIVRRKAKKQRQRLPSHHQRRLPTKSCSKNFSTWWLKEDLWMRKLRCSYNKP